MKIQVAYELLQNAFASGRAAHAYLIAAPPRGAGQALADRLLQYLFCEADKKPCGECGGCTRVGGHTHPDVLWMEPQKKSRIISVDEVRTMQSRIYQTSFEGGWKAVVIVGADRLRDAAANAFLKTLEEPPSRSVFLLLTDSPQSLLPTILSRCQSLAVEGEEDDGLQDDVRERLVHILSTDSAGSAVASLAQAGEMMHLLKAVRVAVEEGEAEQADEDGVEDAAVRDARITARCKEVQAAMMVFAVSWYRDIVMLLCGAEDVVYNVAHAEVLKAHAARITLQDALRNVRHVEEMHRRLERNVQDSAVLGLGFASIK
jgi:DNA polymerase-3 subunit delta'